MLVSESRDGDFLVFFDGGSSVLEMLFSQGFMEVKKPKHVYPRAEGSPHRIISNSSYLSLVGDQEGNQSLINNGAYLSVTHTYATAPQ